MVYESIEKTKKTKKTETVMGLNIKDAEPYTNGEGKQESEKQHFFLQ